MPQSKRTRTPASTGGATWRRRTGKKTIVLTLPPEDAAALTALALTLNLSTVELCRRLVRWAVGAEGGDRIILKKLAE